MNNAKKTVHKTNNSSLNNTSYHSKFFPKEIFFNDKQEVLWSRQMNRIALEDKLLTRNKDNCSIDLAKTFFKGDVFFTIQDHSIETKTTTNFNDLTARQLSKDRARDFHSERVLLTSKGKVQNTLIKVNSTTDKNLKKSNFSKSISLINKDNKTRLNLNEVKQPKLEKKLNQTIIAISTKPVNVNNKSLNKLVKLKHKSQEKKKENKQNIDYLESTTKRVMIDLESESIQVQRKISPMHKMFYESTMLEVKFIF